MLVVDWTHLAQDMDQWRTPADEVINIRFQKLWTLLCSVS
jgi:hypothetical protein